MKFSTRRINEWLIVLLILIILPMLYAFTNNNLNLLPSNFHYFFNMHPTTNILGLNSIQAIDIFGGKEPQGYAFDWYTVSMFLSVVLFLMVGPYLFYNGHKKSKDNADRAKPWYWYIGGAICIGVFSIVPVEIIHMQVFENTKESASKSRTKDMMRAELSEVGFATAQYEILEDGISESFKIEELNLENLKYEYSVERIESDTLITIAISNPDIPDFDVKMDVRPYDKRLLIQRN